MEAEGRGIRCLVIDSPTELDHAVVDPAHRRDFLAALMRYLNSQNVTTYLTMDVPTIVGPELSVAGTPLSILAENLLLLRQVEYPGQIRRPWGCSPGWRVRSMLVLRREASVALDYLRQRIDHGDRADRG